MNDPNAPHRCEGAEYVPVCDSCWAPVDWDDALGRYVHCDATLEPEETA